MPRRVAGALTVATSAAGAPRLLVLAAGVSRDVAAAGSGALYPLCWRAAVALGMLVILDTNTLIQTSVRTYACR